MTLTDAHDPRPLRVPLQSLLGEPLRNGIYKPKGFHGRGTRIINMGELFAHDFIGNQEMHRVELTDREREKCLVRDGDLLFARRSYVLEGSGKCSLVTASEEERTFESSLIRARLDRTKAAPRFYYYMFRSPQGRDLMAAIATRTAVSGIKGSDLGQLLVPWPPIATQRRVVSALSAYDELIESNVRRIGILEEIAQSLYREWFVNFRFPGHPSIGLVESGLELLPEGWNLGRLAESCEIVMGQSPRSEFYNDRREGIPFHQGVTNFGTHFPIDRVYCSVANRTAETGDILFSVRAPVGRINVARKRMVIGRGLSAIRNRDGYQGFALYQLKDRFPEQDSIGSGTIFKAVTKKDVQDIQFLCPDLSVIDAFEAHVQPMLREIENLTDKNANLRTTLDLLLPRLISGEINVSQIDSGIAA